MRGSTPFMVAQYQPLIAGTGLGYNLIKQVQETSWDKHQWAKETFSSLAQD